MRVWPRPGNVQPRRKKNQVRFDSAKKKLKHSAQQWLWSYPTEMPLAGLIFSMFSEGAGGICLFSSSGCQTMPRVLAGSLRSIEQPFGSISRRRRTGFLPSARARAWGRVGWAQSNILQVHSCQFTVRFNSIRPVHSLFRSIIFFLEFNAR